MKTLAQLGAALFALFGGIATVGFLYLWKSIATGSEQLDRVGIRAAIAFWAIAVFGPRAIVDLRIGRALMSIVHNESNGDPSNYLGDATLGGGPSIGPMQVYRKTAKELNLWQPSSPDLAIEDERAEYAALATDEFKGIEWGVRVFKDKLAQAGGDDFADAIRRYNGSGPKAEKYRDNALAFADSKSWSIA